MVTFNLIFFIGCLWLRQLNLLAISFMFCVINNCSILFTKFIDITETSKRGVICVVKEELNAVMIDTSGVCSSTPVNRIDSSYKK